VMACTNSDGWIGNLQSTCRRTGTLLTLSTSAIR
jgi:hypothetical protein